MNDNNIVSIEFDNLYHERYNDTKTMNNLQELIDNVYSIESYNFCGVNDVNILIDKFIDKFNISDNDLILSNHTKLLKYCSNFEKYLNYNNGLISFDGSMIDEQLIESIIFLHANYESVNICKIYDNYFLCFKSKLLSKKENIKVDTFNRLVTMFNHDLENVLTHNKIKNLFVSYDNENFKKKLSQDLNYINKINENYFSNDSQDDTFIYEKQLLNDLSSQNYKVEYHFDVDINIIDKSQYENILSKFKNYNDKLDDIYNSISNYKTVDSANINSLFDTSKLNKLYKKGNIIKMNDVFDSSFEIINDGELDGLSFDKFVGNVMLFLNELTKRKTIKLVRTYNLKTNEINIKNRHHI